MTYEQFRAEAAAMLDEIPEAFTRGLQGLHVLETARPEPAYRGVYRLGEYMDPGFDHFLGGNPGLGRHIALYYGSFARLAQLNPEYDWEEALWNTLTHELRHHVESLAGEDTLIQQDRQRNAHFKKHYAR